MSREWNASAYHRLSDNQFAWGKQVLRRLSVHGTETVLDAGCGSGRVTAELVKMLPHGRVVSVDLSENMVRVAREYLCGWGSRLFFVCADLQKLPFCDLFDGIFSTATFHWVKDHPALFRNLLGALKPGGWLVAQCGGGPNLARLRERVADLMTSPRYSRFFQGWSEPWEFASPELTAERLRCAGFIGIQTSLQAAAFNLPDAGTFKQYLSTVTLHGHLARLPENLQDAFLSELARQAEGESDFTLDYWRLNIDAHKPV